MIKSRTNLDSSSNGENAKHKDKVSSKDSYKVMLDELRLEIHEMSYEEALNKLDNLLNEMQNEHIPVQDLQRQYIRGRIYLERCEELLKHIEQEIIDLNSDTLELKKDI